jgi:flagellar L-ring protein precursor FlgH
VVSQGQFNRQQQSSLDARLRDWLMLDKFDLGPQPQTTGDPRIQGSLTSRLQTNGDSQVRDSMTFEITTRVVDIRPNGTLVLEGRDEVRHNEELWRRSLTGECRREDIQPNNSISARKLYNVRVDKQEQGHVRDSVKRGWLLRAMDGFKPF